MSRIAMIDGVLSSLEEARVSVLDRGFLYGDSVFETIRTYAGEPFLLDPHLARLARSAERVAIPLPLTVEALAVEVLTAVRFAGNAESYVRVMITRGSGELGLDPALAGAPCRVILVTELHAPPEEAYARGIGVVTFPVRRVADGTGAEGAKLGNYLVSVLATRAARAASAAEALIVDGEGRVLEGATSNVFFVRGKELVTAGEEEGILAGITRGVLLEIATDLGLRVVLGAPRVDTLPQFDEIFVSSSIRELLAVVRVDGVPLGGGAPGPVYRSLLEAFRARARGAQPAGVASG